MNEYDEYDNEEHSYIGYNKFLLQQLKSNQHVEKNHFLSSHQTQHSLPCSYQTWKYSAINSWKPQTRHFASSPLSPEETVSKTTTVAVNSNIVSFSASSSQLSEDSLSNNDSSSSPTPKPAEECSAKKISRKGRKGIAAEKNWTRDEIETLFTLWEGNKILYNVSLSDYLKKDKMPAAVKQIAEQLETNEENVRKKMASLRSCYCQLRS